MSEAREASVLDAELRAPRGAVDFSRTFRALTRIPKETKLVVE
jgi:hypothetical protein